jgi:hypothetical protein
MANVKGLALIAATFLIGNGTVQAQYPGGITNRPTVSPYLNLNRSGTSTAINYYGIVRPQFQARATFQSLEQMAESNRQAINEVGAPATGLPTTGHNVAFLNTSGYFMTLGGTGGQGGLFGNSGFGGGFRPLSGSRLTNANQGVMGMGASNRAPRR